MDLPNEPTHFDRGRENENQGLAKENSQLPEGGNEGEHRSA
jgi:hypothetical protein